MPKRRPVNKTFTGCPRCKASKVKCDETKPSCNRCKARGLPCPGYPGTVIRWSTKHEVFKATDQTPTNTKSPSSIPDTPLSFETTSSLDTSLVHRHAASAAVTDSPLHQPRLESPSSTPSATDEKLVSAGSANQSDAWGSSSLRAVNAGQRQSRPSANTLVPWRTSIPQAVTHVPEMLVSYYFQDVCSVFSSFDSDLNPFRSYVSKTFQHSAPVFNAMLSSSAARLADEMPQLKIVGLQYQSQALRCISQSIKGATTISEDTLFAIFLVGLSTAWHDGRDIGLAHFHAAQRAIRSNSISLRGDDQSMRSFFEDALIYWEMAISLVSDEIEFSSGIGSDIPRESATRSTESGEPSYVRVTPHPWTGISLPAQAIFSRVSKAIRALRSIEPRSAPGVLEYQKILGEVFKLEASLWSLELPNMTDIDDTGDPNTPPSHHMLLAEAYIFGGLYQIYRKFPIILKKRREDLSCGPTPRASPPNNPMIEWYNSRPSDTSDHSLLQSLGINILLRLQQIPITSRTRSVQAILIFVAAGSLSMPANPAVVSDLGDMLEVTDIVYETSSDGIARLREFTISRLSSLRKLIHSRPVGLMLQVIKEMYRRLDDREEIFWIDVMQDMKCETMLG